MLTSCKLQFTIFVNLQYYDFLKNKAVGGIYLMLITYLLILEGSYNYDVVDLRSLTYSELQKHYCIENARKEVCL